MLCHTHEWLTRDKTISSEIYKILLETVEEHRAYQNDLIPRKALKYSGKDLCAFANALLSITEADIRKAVFDEFCEK